MADVAQLAEHLVVAQGVVGSNPIIRPSKNLKPLSFAERGFLYFEGGQHPKKTSIFQNYASGPAFIHAPNISINLVA